MRPLRFPASFPPSISTFIEKNYRVFDNSRKDCIRFFGKMSKDMFFAYIIYDNGDAVYYDHITLQGYVVTCYGNITVDPNFSDNAFWIKRLMAIWNQYEQ